MCNRTTEKLNRSVATLSANSVAVLGYVAKHAGCTRKELAAHFDRQKGWSKMFGAIGHEFALRPGLVGLKLVASSDTQPFEYTITASGRAALGKQAKQSKAARKVAASK